MSLTAKEKREQVKIQLQQLRKDLRVMHAGVTEAQTMPDPLEVKTVMTQLEGLLELIEPKSSRKSKNK